MEFDTESILQTSLVGIPLLLLGAFLDQIVFHMPKISYFQLCSLLFIRLITFVYHNVLLKHVAHENSQPKYFMQAAIVPVICLSVLLLIFAPKAQAWRCPQTSTYWSRGSNAGLMHNVNLSYIAPQNLKK